MAFDKNYFVCKAPSTANSQGTWTYRDTVAATSVRAAGYLAINERIRLGDLVEYTQVDNQQTPTSVTAVTLHVVVAISATTGYPDLSDGTTISVTNT